MMQLAAAERKPRVLPGYRFNPSPEELVVSYLEPWVKGQPLGELAGVVCVADVYSCNPAALTERFREFGHDGSWYFLCVARWKASATARGSAAVRGRTAVMSRVVEGGGYWHCSQRKAVVGRLAGRQTFEFRDAQDKKTKWLMEEFSSAMEEASDGTGVKVICKVYLSPRALPQQPAALVNEEEPNVIVGSKRSALHLKNASSVPPPSPPPIKLSGPPLYREYVAPVAPLPLVTVKEERQETNAVSGFKKPRQLDRENVGGYVAPAPAKTYAAGLSHAAPTAAWLQPMREHMRGPVVCHDRVFIKQEMPVGYHHRVFIKQEMAQFTQTAANGAGIAIDVRKEEVAAAAATERIGRDFS